MENHIDVASGGRTEGSIEKLSAAQPAEPAVSLIEVQIPSALFRKNAKLFDRPAEGLSCLKPQDFSIFRPSSNRHPFFCGACLSRMP